VAWWSVVAMLHAFGRGFFSFFAFRGLLGLTESVNFPAALRAVAEWFPKHERSHATGIVTAGTGIGAIVAPPAVFVESPYVAVLLVSTALFAIQVKRSSLFAVPTDLFPAKDVASVWGLSGAAGSLAAAFAQPLIGWLIDTQSYTPVFVIVSLMQIASALAG